MAVILAVAREDPETAGAVQGSSSSILSSLRQHELGAAVLDVLDSAALSVSGEPAALVRLPHYTDAHCLLVQKVRGVEREHCTHARTRTSFLTLLFPSFARLPQLCFRAAEVLKGEAMQQVRASSLHF